MAPRHKWPAMRSVLAGAERLRDQRIEPEQKAHREHQQSEPHRVAESTGGETLLAQTAEHHHVDRAHQHDAELSADHREGERHERARFAPPHAVLDGWRFDT